jgi:hypothetical protein
VRQEMVKRRWVLRSKRREGKAATAALVTAAAPQAATGRAAVRVDGGVYVPCCAEERNLEYSQIIINHVYFAGDSQIAVWSNETRSTRGSSVHHQPGLLRWRRADQWRDEQINGETIERRSCLYVG